MGVRTRGLAISINAKRQAADAAMRRGVIDRWNEQLAAGRDMLWSPTIRAALIAGTPWLDVYRPGCGTSRAIDLRTVDRHPLWPQSVPSCLVYAAAGAQVWRRCRSWLAYIRCRRQRRAQLRRFEFRKAAKLWATWGGPAQLFAI